MKKMRVFFFFSFFLFFFAKVVLARAPLALITSGGVSLGAYEGGFLSYSIQRMAKERGSFPLILTGASAGAINSFLAGMTFCSEGKEGKEGDHFQESLFWKMWVPLSFEKFTSVRDRRSLFDRSFMNPFLSFLEKSWKKGLKKGCEFSLGVSLTRKTPLIFSPKVGINYPRAYESVAFRVRGRGKNLSPHVENIYLNSGVQMAIPFYRHKDNNFTLIKKVILASSSFPLVFPPEKLSYCFIHRQGESCLGDRIRHDFFIDGGVFNNSPLDIAYKISKVIGHKEKTKFYNLNPSVKKYPSRPQRATPKGKGSDGEKDEEGLIKESMELFQNFLTFSRVGNISTFLSEHPDFVERLEIVKTSLPLASAPLNGFFGFFEKDFRIFDFYLGVLEAKKLLGDGKELTRREFLHLEKEWKILECLNLALSDHFSGHSSEHFSFPSFRRICLRESDGILTPNLRALLKTSRDQLFNDCSQVEEKEKSLYSPLCVKISENKLEETLFEREKGKDKSKEKIKSGEMYSHYVSRLLAKNGFLFKDLRLGKGQENLAMVAIKNKMAQAIKDIENHQPIEQRFVLSQFLSSALNFIYYSPPLIKNYILLGENMIDMHRSHVIYRKSLLGHYFRYGYGIHFNGVREIFKTNEYGVGILPNFGLSYEIKALSSELWQSEIGFRGGYQFSTKNNFKLDSCGSSLEISSCSHLISQFIYGLTFLEKVRVQFSMDWIPFAKGMGTKVRNFEFLLGWQF